MVVIHQFGNPGSGNYHGNILGAVSASTTGEPPETINSSSISTATELGGDGIPSDLFSSDDLSPFNGMPMHQHVIPMHSLGGQHYQNAEYVFTFGTGEPGTTIPNGSGQTYSYMDRSPSTDFKLFVNGYSFRGFNNENALRSIGFNQFQNLDNYTAALIPDTNYELGGTAISVTGSGYFVGGAYQFLASTLSIGRGVNMIDTPIETNVFINGDVDHTGDYGLTGKLDVTGDLFLNGNLKSHRIETDKQNIVDLDPQLDNIKALQPREFEWKSNQIQSAGLIAQEVQEVYPSLVKEHKDNLHVNYTGMIPMLIKSIQEQQEMIEKLTSKINELEKKIDK